MSGYVGLTRQQQLFHAWVEGAQAPVDIFGDVTGECYFSDSELVAAWREGAAENRDIHGDANLTNNPYGDESR